MSLMLLVTLLVGAIILGATRVLSIAIVVRGAESRHRAAILRGLAECMKWWKR
jgi:hypothetical protein